MLTRAWYDDYVITPDPGSLTLAMRFYKWGDGTPENALAEYSRFRAQLHQHDNRLPVEWLDQLLREQLGNLHASLPPHFATAAFLFLMQRAAEALERDRWRRFDPPRQWPDAHLRFALDEAMAAEPFGIPPNPDTLLERVRRFLASLLQVPRATGPGSHRPPRPRQRPAAELQPAAASDRETLRPRRRRRKPTHHGTHRRLRPPARVRRRRHRQP